MIKETDKRVFIQTEEATSEAYLRAKNSEHGACILRGTDIVLVFADDTYKVIKSNLPKGIKLPVGTKIILI